MKYMYKSSRNIRNKASKNKGSKIKQAKTQNTNNAGGRIPAHLIYRCN